MAQAGIPPELVGEWRPENTNGEVSFQFRADGFGVIMGIVGAGGIATYDPSNLTLTLSIRNDRTGDEAGKTSLRYDPKDQTLSVEGEGKRVVLKRHSSEISEPLRSFDLKRFLKPSK